MDPVIKTFTPDRLFALLVTLLLTLPQTASAARESDITNTRHNLGSGGPVNSSANSNAICVFCHTPHGASSAPDAGPLWNRTLSTATYNTYGADTLEALDATLGPSGNQLPQPAGSSKLCLSCHDGTLAIASGTTILNAPGSGTGNGIGGLTVAQLASGNNKFLDTDLTNDHPISVTYDSGLGGRDGEMRVVDANQQYSTHIGRSDDGKFTLPLQSTGTVSSAQPGQVQCTTCHDPHLAGSDVFTAINGSTTPANTSIKFLRTNRFQTTDPTGTGTAPVAEGDIICLYCHTKGATADGFASWKESAHANPVVANERYDTGPASEREFPDGIQVWQAACLNCHDTHTAEGQKKLLRKKNSDSAGNQENTCYQCHDSAGTNIISTETGSTVPDIKSEFSKTRRMPITTDDQPAGSEQHNINNADFIEDANNHGKNINSRHAECTDCHNPHRVIRNKRFNANADGLGNDTLRTHESGMNQGTVANDGREGNVASGVLRGAWGVDLANPTTFKNNLSISWPQIMSASDFAVKSGDPGAKTLAQAESANHLTREYQLCFKCHSSYGYNYGNEQSNLGPSLGSTGGSTPSGTNTMTNFTNVAAEFLSVNATNPPSTGTDQGEETNTSGAGGPCGGDCNPTATGPGDDRSNPVAPTANDVNHRSWHPVVYPTGRNRNERSLSASGTVNFKAPWADNIGTQTMQCSDCHGGEDSHIEGTGPDLAKVQGPHGSTSNFLLKGDQSAGYQEWSINGSYLDSANYGFCGNCHQPRVNGTNGSAFRGSGNHRPDNAMGGESCMWCHIAVPHGWKNKQFLANLLCVGPEGAEAGTSTGEDSCASAGGYGDKTYQPRTRKPYYNETRLRVPTWTRSGTWGSSNCGGGNMEDGCPRTRG